MRSKVKRQKVVKEREDLVSEKRKEGRAASVIQSLARGVIGRRLHKMSLPILEHELQVRKYCVECETHTATKRCTQCKDRYCDSCYDKVHKKGYRRGHSWEPLVTVMFGEGSGSDVTGARGNTPGAGRATDQWQEFYDDSVEAKYWFNTLSGEATWVCPY